jgi:antitoxin YefM
VVTSDRDMVRITRRGGEDVVLIAADELSGLLETAHLLKSPKNAARLLKALERANAGSGEARTVDELRGELGLDKKRKATAAKRR